MEEKYKAMGIIGLIALRKSELYYKVIHELSKDKQISEKNKEQIKKYIAEMENERILSGEEKKNKKIRPNFKLKDIDLDIKAVINEIKF